MLTNSVANKTTADADAVSAATSKTPFTIQDVHNLQDFLLAKPTEEDLTDKPYDINSDGCWDVFDLIAEICNGLCRRFTAVAIGVMHIPEGCDMDIADLIEHGLQG